MSEQQIKPLSILLDYAQQLQTEDELAKARKQFFSLPVRMQAQIRDHLREGELLCQRFGKSQLMAEADPSAQAAFNAVLDGFLSLWSQASSYEMPSFPDEPLPPVEPEPEAEA